ncbi:hypothetical protein [Sphingobium yanoikuyae]|uniref:hypothetical protein n=1 Tax=Sphingobium yanoikuyae TaxID=13690 RepID=UPI0024302F57|nr:hypothetical protein [Sphingobium yanoikuyae]
MAVKFKQTTQVGALYNEGDVAAFDEATEKELIDAKVAVPVKAAEKPAEKQA